MGTGARLRFCCAHRLPRDYCARTFSYLYSCWRIPTCAAACLLGSTAPFLYLILRLPLHAVLHSGWVSRVSGNSRLFGFGHIAAAWNAFCCFARATPGGDGWAKGAGAPLTYNVQAAILLFVWLQT